MQGKKVVAPKIIRPEPIFRYGRARGRVGQTMLRGPPDELKFGVISLFGGVIILTMALVPACFKLCAGEGVVVVVVGTIDSVALLLIN